MQIINKQHLYLQRVLGKIFYDIIDIKLILFNYSCYNIVLILDKIKY